MNELLAKELYVTLVVNKLIPEWAQDESDQYIAVFEEVLKSYLVERKN